MQTRNTIELIVLDPEIWLNHSEKEEISEDALFDLTLDHSEICYGLKLDVGLRLRVLEVKSILEIAV